MAVKKILVPTDFSSAADQALDYAVELARPSKAQLIALFVVEPVYAMPGDLYGASATYATLLEEQIAIGRRQLAGLAERLRRRQVPVRALLETGIPWETIVETARSSRADMIVMATHGRTGLAHFFLGSVTEKVVRSAACPVLTMRVGDGAKKRRAKPGKSRKRTK